MLGVDPAQLAVHGDASCDGVGVLRVNPRRVVCQLEREGHLASRGDIALGSDHRGRHVLQRDILQLHVDHRVGRQGDALEIGDRPGQHAGERGQRRGVRRGCCAGLGHLLDDDFDVIDRRTSCEHRIPFRARPGELAALGDGGAHGVGVLRIDLGRVVLQGVGDRYLRAFGLDRLRADHLRRRIRLGDVLQRDLHDCVRRQRDAQQVGDRAGEGPGQTFRSGCRRLGRLSRGHECSRRGVGTRRGCEHESRQDDVDEGVPGLPLRIAHHNDLHLDSGAPQNSC